MTVNIRKIHPQAQTPRKANISDAGFDLCAVCEIDIPPLGRSLVHTGIQISIEDNDLYARIAPRSGLANKHGIDVLAGVIDPGYRGEICVILHNTDNNSIFKIMPGDRIAQIVFERFASPKLIEVDHLSHTERMDSGFGSSGIK